MTRGLQETNPVFSLRAVMKYLLNLLMVKYLLMFLRKNGEVFEVTVER